jgi:hypothetical protein
MYRSIRGEPLVPDPILDGLEERRIVQGQQVCRDDLFEVFSSRGVDPADMFFEVCAHEVNGPLQFV